MPEEEDEEEESENHQEKEWIFDNFLSYLLM